MSVRVAEPRAGARAVRADVCPTCGGIWLDEYELGEVSDPLGGLPFRLEEIAEHGAPGRNLACCPRCGAKPSELAVLDVALDFCSGCHGVWLDGGEYEALARATALEAAREAEATGDYRTAPAAAKAIKRGVFDCPRCNRELPTSAAMLTPRGMVCAPCYHAHDEAEILADASRDHGELTDRMKLGAIRPHDAHIGGEGWQRVGAMAGGAVSLLGVLVGLGQPEFCERCGRRRSSPACPHYG